MRETLIKLGLAFLLGSAATFAGLNYFNRLEMDKMAQEVFSLEKKNSALQERVRMLQLSLDKIEEEVIVEQTPKKPDQITAYWNSAYRLYKQRRTVQCADPEQGGDSSLLGLSVSGGSGAICTDR